MWRSFCSIFFVAVSISLCGLLVGIFLGNHVAGIESADLNGPDGVFRMNVDNDGDSRAVGLLAIPAGVPKTNNTTVKRIEHAEGSVRSQLRMNQVICTEIEFDGTFDSIPGILGTVSS